MDTVLQRSNFSLGKISGSSPAEDRFYVAIFFDISDPKKWRVLTKTLKEYGQRIQRSVFEAQLKRVQIKTLTAAIERLMESEKYFNSDDNVRIYCISGNCEVTVFGGYQSNMLEENIFI